MCARHREDQTAWPPLTSPGNGVARWKARVLCRPRGYNLAFVVEPLSRGRNRCRGVQRCLIRDITSQAAIDVLAESNIEVA